MSRWVMMCLAVFSLTVFGPPDSLVAQESEARLVTVRWNMGASAGQELTVRLAGRGDSLMGAGAWGFELQKTDRVVLEFDWGSAGVSPQGVIEFAVSGTDPDADALRLFRSLAGLGSPAALSPEDVSVDERGTTVLRVTDRLLAGGALTATFKLTEEMEAGGNAKRVTVYESQAVTLRVKSERPRFTVSTGIGISRGPEPSLAIVKTDSIVTITRGTETSQTYQPMLLMRNADPRLEPIQTMVTFFNVRLWEWVYASLGLQADGKIFQEPIVGVTARIGDASGIGLNVFAGGHFNREADFVRDSGFSSGQRLDPALALTLEDVPLETRTALRFILGFSFDFVGLGGG